MGKKNKKMIHKVNNVQQRREIEKEKERVRALNEVNCIFDGLASLDSEFKKHGCPNVSKNKVNLTLVKNLIFNMVVLPKEFRDDTVSKIVSDLTKAGLFASIRPKSVYKKGVLTEVSDEISKIYNKLSPDLADEILELYIKTIAIYFEYDKELKKEITSDFESYNQWCVGVLEKTMLFVMLRHTGERIITIDRLGKVVYDGIFNNFMPSNQEDEESLLENIKDTVGRKDNRVPFSSTYLVGLKSEELKNILTELINGYYNYSEVTDKLPIEEMISKTPDGFTPYSYEAVYGDSDLDFSTLVKISRLEVKKVKGNIYESFDMLSCYEHIKTAVTIAGVYQADMFNDYFINTTTEARINAFIKNKDLLFSELKEKSDKEVKELTSQVRTLRKDFTKLEKSFEEAEKRIQEYEESEKVEIADTQIILDISEVEEYKKTIERLENKISEDKDDYSKISNKSGWQENRIKELEEKLKYYSSLENDMMSLQNEMNILSAQVDKLEEMGQEDEDVKQKRFEEHLEAIKDLPILFVGGTGNMMSKFMPLFPNSDYIDISDEGVNFTVPQRFAYVVVYTRVVTHSHCARVESMVEKDKIIPVNIFNTELVVEELYKNIIGHKK